MDYSPRKNILHVIHNLQREGAQKVCFNLLTTINLSKFTPVIYAFKNEGPMVEDFIKKEIQVYSPSSNRNYSSRKLVLDLVNFITANNIQLVHAHMSESAILAFVACVYTKTPFMITHHSNKLIPDLNGAKKYLRYVLFFNAMRFAKINIAVSKDVESKIKNLWCGHFLNKNTIPNGVKIQERDVPEKLNENNLQFQNKDTWPNLIIVGRVVALKGQKFLIKSAPSFFELYPQGQITIVGDGNLRTELEEFTKKIGFADQIIFKGQISNVDEELKKADVYVSASEYEGLPMSVMEAMSFGIPVVASDVPGNRDLIKDCETGLLYKYGDIHSFLDALRTVLTDTKLQKKICDESRILISERFSIGSMTKAYEDIYNLYLMKNN